VHCCRRLYSAAASNFTFVLHLGGTPRAHALLSFGVTKLEKKIFP
jgi:hypothetical protein